jgi:TonB-dependent SusC/RagA subfamily outer membrane receptor
VDVVLQPDVQSLAEAVVVGYGAVRKADLTGAAATVGRRQFGDRAVTSVSQLLEGRVAGVDLTRASGAVDAGTNSKVRGTNSLSGTDPLWIVNGMPGDPNMLNPNDIESVTVLKDASATAIYGARGANGVFIVTTRGGEPGQTKVEYRGLHGVATPGRKLDLLDAPGYADLLYDIKGGAYNPEMGHWEAPAGLPAKLYDPAYLRTTRTDWQDQIFRTRPLSDHHVSVSGGRDHARFKMSLGYQHQGQTGGNKVYNRLNLLVHSEYKIGKRLRFGENVAVRQVRLRGNDPNILGALRMPPAEPVFSPDDGNAGGYSLVTTPRRRERCGQPGGGDGTDQPAVGGDQVCRQPLGGSGFVQTPDLPVAGGLRTGGRPLAALEPGPPERQRQAYRRTGGGAQPKRTAPTGKLPDLPSGLVNAPPHGDGRQLLLPRGQRPFGRNPGHGL